MCDTFKKRSMLCPGATAPGGTVRETPESGRVILAPWQVTDAQAVNLGSVELCLSGDDGGSDIGVDGSGVEVIGKLLEVEMPPRSKVPPAVLVGLEWPPAEMEKESISLDDKQCYKI